MALEHNRLPGIQQAGKTSQEKWWPHGFWGMIGSNIFFEFVFCEWSQWDRRVCARSLVWWLTLGPAFPASLKGKNLGHLLSTFWFHGPPGAPSLLPPVREHCAPAPAGARVIRVSAWALPHFGVGHSSGRLCPGLPAWPGAFSSSWVSLSATLDPDT